jgi:putative phosphoesterase
MRKSIGVISDTHGLLRPEVRSVFEGVELIFHAGDIGSAEVLDKLQSIAPTIAVRGNNDWGAWASRIPEVQQTRIGGLSIYMLHDLKQISETVLGAACDVVISGHSHHPRVETKDGILYVNPGSAGPRRFKLPISVARLTLGRSGASAELINLL